MFVVNQTRWSRIFWLSLTLFISLRVSKQTAYGLDICIMDISNAGISDHFPVMFNIEICHVELNCEDFLYKVCNINPEAIVHFSTALTNSAFYDDNCKTTTPVNELTNSFISIYTSILNTVAPLKTKRFKPNRQPWLNESTHTLRRECHRGELQISLDILQNCRLKYQKAVKVTKSFFPVGNHCN